MFTKQSAAIESLREHLPSAAVDILLSVLANCSQPLEHRAAITIDFDGTGAVGEASPTVAACSDDGYAGLHVKNTGGVYNQTDQTVAGGWAAKFDGPVNICPAVGSEAIDVGLVTPGAEIGDLIVTGDIIIEGDIRTTVGGNLYASLPIGSVVMWAMGSGSVPSGWAIMDGNQGGSEIDMRTNFLRGKSGGTPGDNPQGKATHDHGNTDANNDNTGAPSPNYTNMVEVAAHSPHVHAPIAGEVEDGKGATVWDGEENSGNELAPLTHTTHGHSLGGHVHTMNNHKHSVSTSVDPGDLPPHQELHFIERVS